MNKGNLNKLVTNYPVELTEEEISNLSGTLAPVIAACGGGGGGTGGKIYTGIGFVNVNNSTNQIGLTEAANTKLNQDIPTKVSDLSDSANYQTVAGMDQYLTELEAQSTYLTKSSADNDYAPLNVTANVNTLVEASADWNEVSAKVNTSDLNTYLTNYYQKTETSSKNQITDALNTLEESLQENINDVSRNKQDKLTFGYDENNAISSIDNTPLAGQGGTTYTNGDGIAITNNTISISSNYIAAITSVSGKQNTISFTYTTAEEHPNVKYLATMTTDNEVYTIGDTGGGGGVVPYEGKDGIYVLNTDIGLSADYKTQIETVSSKLSTVATTEGSITGLGTSLSPVGLKTSAENALTSIYGISTDVGTLKTASAGWNEVTAKLDKFIYSNASGNWEASYNVLTAYSAAGTWLTEHQSLTNYYTKDETSGATELSTEFGKYLTTAQYNTDSATFALKSDLNGLVNSASVTTNDNYVMTNTGWKVLTLPGGGMTQVYHDTTLTGDGNSNDNQLSVAWSALSGNTIYSAIKAASASAAKRLQDSTEGPIIQVGDVTALQNWASSNSSTWDGVTAKLGTAQYATDSATFYTTSNTAGYLTKTVADTYYQPTGSYATSAGLTAGNQYAMTTNGWAVVSTPTIPDITANNGLSANGHTIGIDNTNLVTDTQYAWTTTGWSDIGLSAYLPLSGGTVSGDVIVKSTGKNLLAVNTEATLMGQSRVANLTDTTAIGTNWMGVNSYGGGFLKNVQGGNVGALNGTSIQINFAPDGANSYGNITVNSQDNMSKVVHIPTASYNSMSSFDNTNGPNYMLRKTSSGFDIGAAVINVTTLPAQTEANTYYFIYDT